MRKNDLGRRIRILVVEDHPVMRRGIHALIDGEPDMVVCGESEDGADALVRTAELSPDVTSVDLNLGDDSGLDLIKRLREVRSAMKILVLSMHEERAFAERALEAGANGYLAKTEAPKKLLGAIRRLVRAPAHSPCMAAEECDVGPR